jgi:hypothetical protein
MTIEIVTTTTATADSTMAGSATITSCHLPVLRLNSENLDEIEEFRCLSDRLANSKLLEEDEDRIDCGIESGSEFIQSSSNYNSSDGEQDTIVFTDDESNHSKAALTLASTLEFLEKQQQQYTSRRDSDSSCDDRSCNENENESSNKSQTSESATTNEDPAARIVRQIETMFSDDHLAKDGFLLKHVRRRSDGFVSLKLVAGLRKVKQISKDFNTVVEALRNAKTVELNTDGTKVRRVAPLTTHLKSLPTTSGNKDKENGQKSKNNSRNSSMEQQPLSEADLAKW